MRMEFPFGIGRGGGEAVGMGALGAEVAQDWAAIAWADRFDLSGRREGQATGARSGKVDGVVILGCPANAPPKGGG